MRNARGAPRAGWRVRQLDPETRSCMVRKRKSEAGEAVEKTRAKANIQRMDGSGAATAVTPKD